MLAAGLAVAALLLVAAMPTEARKDGVSGRAEVGCTCHGGGSRDTSVLAALDGTPAQYEPGKLYHLSVSLAGGPPYAKAGFNLNASKGTLAVPSVEKNVQITTKASFGAVAGEATHKTPDSRKWAIDWTAPQAGSGRITFRVATNSVNGNNQPDALDKWNLVSKTSDEKNLAPAPVTLEPIRQVAPGRVNISWSGRIDPDLARLEVHRGSKAAFPMTAASKVAEVKDAKATSIEVDKLEPNHTHYFRLRIVDKGGLTADSGEQSVLLEPMIQPAAETASPAAAGFAPGLGSGMALLACLTAAGAGRAGARVRRRLRPIDRVRTCSNHGEPAPRAQAPTEVRRDV